MKVIASSVYDLTITAELLEDGTVKVVWSTGEPGHVSAMYDEGDQDDLNDLDAWITSHTASEVAKLADEDGLSYIDRTAK